jgi:hypothetical protein
MPGSLIAHPLFIQSTPHPTDQGVIANFKTNYLCETFSMPVTKCDADDTLSIKEFWFQFNNKITELFSHTPPVAIT